MATLVLLLQPRPRLRAGGPGEIAPGLGRGAEFDYVLSSDGLAPTSSGRCAASLLPKANQVVAVLGDSDVGWHRITLPKAPAQRLRAALAGVLEDGLLDDDAHLAVAPQAVAGKPTWIAAVNRPWLMAQLNALEQAQVFVNRVVPVSWPDDPPSGHFAEQSGSAADERAALSLTWAHAEGVATVRLQGGLARSLLPDPLPDGVRWTATAAAAEQASAWLGAPVPVISAGQRALQALRSTWNLRQFELASRHRGTRALRDVWRQWLSPAWRPVRWGAAALVAVQILGLNLWAWRQHATLGERQAAMVALLRSSYPQITAVLDAPVQMQRETDALRAIAGRSGEADIEPLLQAAASAWPANRPPVNGLRFEPGRLTLNAAGWGNDEIEQFRSRLQPAGWQVETAEGKLVLSRAGARAGGS